MNIQNQPKIGFIGTGTMAGIMLQAALDRGFLQPEQVLVYDKLPASAARFGVPVAASAAELATQCDIIHLGVKPQDQPALLAALDLTDKLVISIAAGVTLAKLGLPRAMRLMPNLNSAAGQGITAYCATDLVGEHELSFVRDYCACFGQAIALPEEDFSAFLALAASGPAFVYQFIADMAAAGQQLGLASDVALHIAAQCALGSAAMVQQSDAPPNELVRRVCSPGGTTIAGMQALQQHGFSHAVQQAVHAAAARDRELGQASN
ncbi:MAG: pyrroline-5-carboxylate reductase [Oscillospiraceae bacterium]|nr:pyrroline-5-carboxylate reductase [Oscillospiraceae bacterium]